MRQAGFWLKLKLGKKLIKLHLWNAWAVLLLALTGILLFVPAVRETGAFRVQLKYVLWQLAQATASDGNRMLPLPTPMPESNPSAGGGAQGNFRIYTVTALPKYTPENWVFAVGGLAEQPRVWKWEEFWELPRKVPVSDFHCVTGWSVYKATWEGSRLRAC